VDGNNLNPQILNNHKKTLSQWTNKELNLAVQIQKYWYKLFSNLVNSENRMKLNVKSNKDKNFMVLVFQVKTLLMVFQIGNKLINNIRPSTPIKNVICNTYAE
jgi:hypothetical protein